MRPNPFLKVETWVFDLDNTLYPPSTRLVDRINERMTRFMMRELGLGRAAADRLRTLYWRRHGITLAGLVAEHGVDPAVFLAEVHDIELEGLRSDAGLVAAVAALRGRRIVHTNGSRVHAVRVLAACGLGGAFDAVYGIEDKGLLPKPQPQAYARILALDGFNPARAAMIEDTVENLAEPKRLGMGTVWLCHKEGRKAPPHVDRRITRLAEFLTECC